MNEIWCDIKGDWCDKPFVGKCGDQQENPVFRAIGIFRQACIVAVDQFEDRTNILGTSPVNEPPEIKPATQETVMAFIPGTGTLRMSEGEYTEMTKYS